AGQPVPQARFARDAKTGAGDAAAAATLARHRPVEEGDVVARAADLVGVEEVVGADVVLVHASLHQAHAKDLRVEALVAADVRRDRRQVVETTEVQVHECSLSWGGAGVTS